MEENASVKVEALLDRVENDLQLLSELVEIFQKHYSFNLENIQDAIEEKNTEKLEKAAHALKGSTLNLEAWKATELALQLEKAGHEGKIEEAKKIYASLVQEITKVVSDLQAIIDNKM